MERTMYRGAVRDGQAEAARDVRMLALHEQGVSRAVIAQRMGVSVASVSLRIKRARSQRDGAKQRGAPTCSRQRVDDTP